MKELGNGEFAPEEMGKNQRPFFIWICLTIFIFALAYTVTSDQGKILTEKVLHQPFYQVTNREMSLFLWSNPELMRMHAQYKTGYLTAFDEKSPHLDPHEVQNWAVAPEEVLFFYHTWKRLLYTQTPVIQATFEELKIFQEEYPEWKGASAREVELAYSGWRNYFQNQKAITEYRPKYEELVILLKNHPHYAYSYWKNLINSSYLLDYFKGNAAPHDEIPQEQLSGFLKTALFVMGQQNIKTI